MALKVDSDEFVAFARPDGTPSLRDSLPTSTISSPVLGKPVDFDFQRWESTGLGAYLFTKGIGDQFEALLEIMCETSEDSLATGVPATCKSRGSPWTVCAKLLMRWHPLRNFFVLEFV